MVITDNIPLWRSKGFNSPPLTTHRSTSKWGRKPPKRIIRPKVKTVGCQPTNKGSSPLLSAKTLVYESAKHRRIARCHRREVWNAGCSRESFGRFAPLMRRLGKPNLLPHRCTLWGIFAVRPRPRAADFFISTQSQ